MTLVPVETQDSLARRYAPSWPGWTREVGTGAWGLFLALEGGCLQCAYQPSVWGAGRGLGGHCSSHPVGEHAPPKPSPTGPLSVLTGHVSHPTCPDGLTPPPGRPGQAWNQLPRTPRSTCKSCCRMGALGRGGHLREGPEGSHWFPGAPSSWGTGCGAGTTSGADTGPPGTVWTQCRHIRPQVVMAETMREGKGCRKPTGPPQLCPRG